MKMATMLIETMGASFEPRELKDHYRDELMAVIDARARGRRVPAAKGKARGATNVVDLVKVLERSIAETRGRERAREASRAATGVQKPKRARSARRSTRAA
jgi:DNA end-binding protein Ku